MATTGRRAQNREEWKEVVARRGKKKREKREREEKSAKSGIVGSR